MAGTREECSHSWIVGGPEWLVSNRRVVCTRGGAGLGPATDSFGPWPTSPVPGREAVVSHSRKIAAGGPRSRSTHASGATRSATCAERRAPVVDRRPPATAASSKARRIVRRSGRHIPTRATRRVLPSKLIGVYVVREGKRSGPAGGGPERGATLKTGFRRHWAFDDCGSFCVSVRWAIGALFVLGAPGLALQPLVRVGHFRSDGTRNVSWSRGASFLAPLIGTWWWSPPFGASTRRARF